MKPVSKSILWKAAGGFAVLLGILIFGSVFTAKASAATYYVNNQSGSNCSDAGTGTSTSQPWCSFTPVNTKGTYTAGDSIMLARGATWNQQMTVTGTGTSGSMIAIDAYGSGNRPKIIRNGSESERAIRLNNPDYWKISNIEVGNAGTGILVYFTSIGHNGLFFNNVYAHDIKGIHQGSGSGATDQIWNSAGIEITGQNGLTLTNTQYVLNNVRIDNFEGTHNLDSISFDFHNGDNFIISNGGDGENLVQNVVLNNLYLHDDNQGGGSATGCDEGLRFVAVSHATIMNSVLDNEASCPSGTGTAAIIFGRLYDVTFVNGVIKNLPNTGSGDQTAVDYEALNDTVRIRNSFIGNNAGPGIKYLSIHEGSYNRYPEASGNVFVANGENAIRQQGDANDLPVGGTISNNLYTEDEFMNSYTGMSTVSNNKSVSASFVYYAGNQFGSTQGGNQWSYQSYNGSSWTNLGYYDSANKRWQSSSTVSVPSVGAFEQNPDSCAICIVARAWTAPNAGTVTIRGRILKSDVSAGNGVIARITKNGSRIWPSSSDQTINYNDLVGAEQVLDSVGVAAGDVIRFEVQSNGSNANDMTSWSPAIAYTGAWDFNTGSKDGWTNLNGMTVGVSGGILTATSNDTDPAIWSQDNLNIAISSSTRYLKIRLKNNTGDTGAVVYFATNASDFNGAKSKAFTTGANMGSYVEYTLDMSTVAGWTGTLKRLRFDPFSTTGSVNIDYITLSDGGTGGGSDTTAPSSVSNLSVSSTNSNSATLSWTAPGDDGNSGTAASYDIRYSTSAITSGNWASATQASGEPSPSAAGTGQTFAVTGLNPNTTYYFAIKSTDESANESSLSNVPSGTTQASGGESFAYDWGFASTSEGWSNGNQISQSVSAGINTLTSSGTDPYLFSPNDLNFNASTYKKIKIRLKNNTTGTGAEWFFTTTSDTSWNAAKSKAFTIAASDGGYTEYVIDMTSVAGWSGTIKQLRFDPYGNAGTMNVDYIRISDGATGGGTDTTAPAAVSNLAAGSATSSSIPLAWTAPGDDGSTGTATSYDIRYSTSAITSGNWASATQVAGEPNPGTAGTSQSFTVTGLAASTTYYFAIKTTDEASNVSSISNVPSLATSAASTTLANAGFEATSISGFAYNPTGASWTFLNGAGIQHNGSDFSAPSAPEGTQTAFLQGEDASFSQSVTFAAGSHTIGFKAAKRSFGGTQSFQVKIDGTVVGTFAPSSTSFASLATSSFTTTAGAHTIEFIGTVDGDNTDFIDDIVIN